MHVAVMEVINPTSTILYVQLNLSLYLTEMQAQDQCLQHSNLK